MNYHDTPGLPYKIYVSAMYKAKKSDWELNTERPLIIIIWTIFYHDNLCIIYINGIHSDKD